MDVLVKRYQKFLCVGCSHGAYIDRDAAEKVLEFRERWQPERVIHLGDVFDQTAFRAGAPGTKDEAASIEDDMTAGIDFLTALQPTDVLIGNHDERIFKAAQHHNAIIARAAGSCRNEFLTACDRLGARLVDHYDARRSWIELGNFRLLHGWWYNENSLRDHAETYGNVIMAHLHAPGVAHGRRSDFPRGYCVGMLADADKLDYAHRRRATLRWALGFAWGEFSPDDCQVNISECESGKAKSWRLPL